MSLVGRVLAGTTRFFIGAYPYWMGIKPDSTQRIYFANHASHLDTMAIWSSLPPQERYHTRPVAAKDYWDKSPLRRYISNKVLHVVYIDRESKTRNPLRTLEEALDRNDSLILFPEGTRNTTGNMPSEFKGGLYLLAKKYPHVELVPVFLDNTHRSLPKGMFLPLPFTSTVSYGSPISLLPEETKEQFLSKAREAVIALSLHGHY